MGPRRGTALTDAGWARRTGEAGTAGAIPAGHIIWNVLVTDNCRHFLRDALRAGDLAEEHDFPKNRVWAYLERHTDRAGIRPR